MDAVQDTENQVDTEDQVHVLLVDDRPENLLALEAILDDLSLECHTAASGEEALGKVLEHQYALILMDVQMPGMDGFETASLIKGRKTTRHIPIIFVTALSTEEKYVYEGYESGAVDYLFKPLDQEIVRSKVSVFADLYRQKREVERAHTELDQAHAELKSAQKELIQSSKLESIGRLASSVAHEVKNPLQIQRMGLSYLIKKHPDLSSDTCLEMMQDMDEAIGRAESIIAGLVDYSSFRKLEIEQLDANEVMQQVLQMEKAALQSRNVEVIQELQADLPPCHADRQKLMQVFLNLIENARQAMPDGGQLKIRSSETGSENGAPHYVQIEIEDSGGGVAEEVMHRVFDPFFTTRTDEKQAGLGLSVCIGIVEMHQGSVRIENRALGACAILELPA